MADLVGLITNLCIGKDGTLFDFVNNDQLVAKKVNVT